jgi:MFS family permease
MMRKQTFDLTWKYTEVSGMALAFTQWQPVNLPHDAMIAKSRAASIVGGILSDRFKRRKVFVLVAGLIYGVGIVIVAFASSFWIFLIGTLISNLALGVYAAVDQALVTDVLPNRETEGAKGMGIFTIAQSLPQSLAPAIAPLFLAIGGGNNYTALYLVAGLLALLGAFAIQPIKGVR